MHVWQTHTFRRAIIREAVEPGSACAAQAMDSMQLIMTATSLKVSCLTSSCARETPDPDAVCRANLKATLGRQMGKACLMSNAVHAHENGYLLIQSLRSMRGQQNIAGARPSSLPPDSMAQPWCLH